MKNLEILNKNIELLNLDRSILNKLNSIDIFKVEDLWKCSSNYLKNNEFTYNDINEVRIKLQLSGIDLNKKVY